MYGRYPAVSIHKTKIHIHRLLYGFVHQVGFFKDDYIHHKNHDRLDAQIENLELMKGAAHSSYHNNGKTLTPEHRAKLTEANKRNWNGKWKHRRIHENKELLG